jgi:glutathione peroxidase
MKIAVLCLLLVAMAAVVRADDAADKDYPPVLDFTMQTLAGDDVHLGEKYAGKVVLLVNVASRCGYTPQYEGLQALHKKYGEQGLAVVGVPCNQFGKQEPGTADEIAAFCDKNYGVSFDMLAKVNVRADQDEQTPLYQYLTSEKTNPDHGGNVKWNFEKFLIARDGTIVGHYKSSVSPDSKQLVAAIESELAKPAPKAE